jgi:hypothetical protein
MKETVQVILKIEMTLVSSLWCICNGNNTFYVMPGDKSMLRVCRLQNERRKSSHEYKHIQADEDEYRIKVRTESKILEQSFLTREEEGLFSSTKKTKKTQRK